MDDMISSHVPHDNLSEDVPLKRCTKCGKEKPATPEFFCRQTKGKDGLMANCRECGRARRNAHYAANRDQANAYYIEHRDHILARTKAHHAANRDHKSTYNKAYRAEHRDYLQTYGKDWRAEHRDYVQAYNESYHVANRDRILVQQKVYHAKNHDRFRAYHHTHRARIRAVGGTFTKQDIQNLLKGQKGKCAECKKKLVKYHIDHIIPKSRGGSNWPYNLQLLCPPCNLRKHNKLPHEFSGSGQMRLFS